MARATRSAGALVAGWLASLVAFGGCAADGPKGAGLGETCSHTIECAEGGVCDYTAPDGPVCIDADGDNDGDGLPNSIDHCPNAPGGLYDEDNDGIGDDCDKCPIAPPPAVPDPDGDDVDSPCDPDPLTPGDKILLFDGFQGSALGSEWTPIAGSTWTPQFGELVVDANAPDEQYLVANVVASPNFAVEAAYRVDALEPSAGTHAVGARALDASPAGVAELECGAVESGTGSNDLVVVQTNLSSSSVPAMVPAFDTAKLYEVAAYSTAANVGCTVIGDNTTLGATQVGISPGALGNVALGVRAAKARFEWVLVVGRSN